MLLGIEIGGTKLQLVLGDSSGEILDHRKVNVDPHRGAAGIQEQIQRLIPDLLGGGCLAATGAGFGGPVDWRRGTICRSHQIEGWSEFDLAGWLSQFTGAPARVDNDADVGALGEALRGAGVGCNPVFYVTLGSGVGGGLVVDGKIYHGATPGEAEVGHVRLDRQGTIVEHRCSGWSVDARIRSLRKTRPKSELARLAAEDAGAESRHLAAALRANDEAARHVLEQTAEDLAFGLSHVVHLVHPEIIILGGGLSKIGEPLLTAVQRHLRGFVMEAFAPGPRLALAALGEDAVPVGALELARAAADTRAL